MQTRYMERTNSMKGKGKRSLEHGAGEEPERDKKRPALASVIVEALKVDSIQRLFSSLEPILRRVVSEEVERALAKLVPARLAGSERSSPKCIEGPDGRNLQLQFNSKLSLPLFTGGKVEGDQGASIHVVLMDSSTGHVVTSGPESSLKLDIVVLEGDFNNEDAEGWTEEEFESHIVKERDGKRPLLTGDLQVTLREGVGTLGDNLSFTDNSSWIRSRKFRLGLRVASGYCESIRIQEASTEAFTVKDHRGELYKKHYPPALDDEVWRLEKIGKDGSFHKKLNAAGINTVEHFLRLGVRDSAKLRNLLGSGMSNKMWEALMDHAKTCALGGKLYVYYQDDTRTAGVVFNNIYELTGLIACEQYFPADSLSEAQKIYVDSLMKKAYDNWGQVVEYDSESLLNIKQNRKSNVARFDLLSGPNNYSHSLDNQIQVPRFSVSAPSELPTMDHNILAGGSSYFNSPPQLMMPNPRSHYEFPSYTESNQQVDHLPEINREGADLALYEDPSASSFQVTNSSLHHSNANPFDNWSSDPNNSIDEFLSEEEIRMRTQEMLENEDMQQMFRVYSMGGGYSSADISEDGYGSSSYMPYSTPGFSYNKSGARSSKAVAGWLKIKAAMRWGIFVRRKAAEKRARIQELDED